MPYFVKVEHLAALTGKATPLIPDLVEWINKNVARYMK